MTFVRVDGVGALQIRSYGSGDKEVADEDLSRDDGNPHLAPEEVSYGHFVGLGIRERTATGSWRKYWLRSLSVMLFVTYNCNLADEGVEDREVDWILHSLALSESASKRVGLLN